MRRLLGVRTQPEGAVSHEAEETDFTVYILQQNTVVGTNVDWVSRNGIYGLLCFQSEIKSVTSAMQLSSTKLQAQMREGQDEEAILRFTSAF